MKKKIISIVGARPNFMKVAPIHFEFRKFKNIEHLICHTGQHYDEKMSRIFFDELGLPKPDFYLGIGSGSHAVQTAGVMIEFEKILLQEKPDLVIVVGDVNSTVACSLVAKKLNIDVAHVEAGLRSFDMKMPEEINRLLTDVISDYLFVSEQSGMDNLKNSGISAEKTFLVGNVMIDSLVNNLAKINNSTILDTLDIKKGEFILATLHRPSNVDNPESLVALVTILNKYARSYKLVFPLHPRTRSNLINFRLLEQVDDDIILCDPLGYIDFVCLLKNAALVVTDSGGIQEETTFLNTQCITIRDNTERPITVDMGTNQLIGTNVNDIDLAISSTLSGRVKNGTIPPLWDGFTAKRICEIIVKELDANEQD
jgi:UDP-N-acetylglucosamine 2-epimerase (non-hydrolysing)